MRNSKKKIENSAHRKYYRKQEIENSMEKNE